MYIYKHHTMDIMRKFADALGAGALVSTMSDESLVAAVRQLLGYSPGDTFEHLRTQVRTQASLFGEDIRSSGGRKFSSL